MCTDGLVLVDRHFYIRERPFFCRKESERVGWNVMYVLTWYDVLVFIVEEEVERFIEQRYLV